MPEQLPLCLDTPSPLPCVYGATGEGWAGPHHCPSCAAEVAAACARFDAAVARGAINARGYTRAEWRAAGHDPATWARATGWGEA